MRRSLSSVLALALVLGCQASPTLPGKKPVGGGATPKPKATIAAKGGTGTPGEARAIAQTGTPTQLTGKVKLISVNGSGLISVNGSGIVSNNGGGIISNNSGAIISDQGGSLVSDQGGGLVSDQGGGLTGKTKRALLAAGAAPVESRLAEARIEVLDAAGRVLTDAKGQPLGATTDRFGNYQLSAVLPPENVVLRAKVHDGGALAGGALQALVAGKAAAGPLPIDLDTASSLGAAYVLGKYVASQPNPQAVFDKLPRDAERALQRDMTTALALLPPGPPRYEAEALAAAAQRLREGSPAVDAALTRIEAILVAGQQGLGAGLPATRVALGKPAATIVDAAGELLIAEAVGGRVRRLRADGTLELVAGGGPKGGDVTGLPAREASFGVLADMALAPDGSVLIAEVLENRIYRLLADGTLALLAGNGDGAPQGKQGPVDVPATATSFMGVSCLAVGPDGAVYVGEVARSQGLPGRVLRIDPDGVLRRVATDEPFWVGSDVAGLAVAPDGTLFGLNGSKDVKALARLRPGAAGWELVAGDLALNQTSRVAIAPDGGVLVSETGANRVVRFPPGGGPREVVVGTGKPGSDGDGGPATAARLNRPSGLWHGPDGTLYVADAGAGLVRAVRGGTITTVAGTPGFAATGDAATIALSFPAGLALDPQGRLVVSELAGATVKRVDGGAVALLAGTGVGAASAAAEGEPAAETRFSGPTAIAYMGPDLYVADTGLFRIRKLGADGLVTTAVGTGVRGHLGAKTAPAREIGLRNPIALAAGPDGRLYWTDAESHQVARLNADGQAELIAGTTQYKGLGGEAGDGGPADAAELARPYGLAFDSKGDLYVADAANLRIRKVAMGEATRPIAAFAGMGKAGLGKILEPGAPLPAEEGTPAAEALLMLPGVLAFDDEDNLYVGEFGTKNLGSVSGLAGIVLPELPKFGARIRKIALRKPGMPITTVAGPGGVVLTAATGDDALMMPMGLLFAKGRGLYVADGGNNQVKLIPLDALRAR